MNPVRAAILAFICLCTVDWPTSSAAPGKPAVRPPPDLLERVGIEQRLGAQLPSDLAFRDTDGSPVRLLDLLAGQPAVLVPGYYTCRNLCDLVRAGVAHAIRASGLTPGREFNVVLISIDPAESTAAALAAQRGDAQAHPLAHIGRWHYLTGTGQASGALAQALGFRYLFDSRNAQYVHAAGIVVVSPRGVITQYLPGVQFLPLTLRLALVNASAGRIGTLADRVLLLCCDYDSSTGRYSLLIGRVLQGLGLLTVLALAGSILWLRRLEARRRAAEARP